MAFLGQIKNPDNSFGIQLGGQIGKALEGLAEKKVQQAKVNNNRQFLNSLGINPEVSNQLAHKDDQFIGDFLKQYEGFNIGNQTQQAPQQYQQAMEGLTPQQAQQGFSPNQPNVPNQNQQPSIPELVRGMYAQHPGLENSIAPAQLAELIKVQQQQAQQVPVQQATGIRSKGSSSAQNPQVLAQKEQAIQAVKKAQVIIDQGKEAQKKIKILEQMEKLAKSGKLSGGTWANLHKTLGTSSSWLGVSPETERFDKLSAQLLPENATEEQIKASTRKVPNVGQSQQAKLAVIKDLKSEFKDKAQEAKRAQQIISANSGRVPFNIDELVQSHSSNQESQSIGLKPIEEANSLQDLKAQNGDKAQGPNGQWYEFNNGKWITSQGI